MSDKTKKEKGSNGKTKGKTESVKVKSEGVKVKKKTAEGVMTKKKDSSSSSASKLLKTVKDASNLTTTKKEKSKISVRSTAVKTPPLSSQNPFPSLHEGSRSDHDLRGRRDPPQSLLSLPHQHGLPHLPRPSSPIDNRRRMGEECRSLLRPPGKLRRIDGIEGGGDVLSHSHLPHQLGLHRFSAPSDRLSNLPPMQVSRDLVRGDSDRSAIRPLMDIPVSMFVEEFNVSLQSKWCSVVF